MIRFRRFRVQRGGSWSTLESWESKYTAQPDSRQYFEAINADAQVVAERITAAISGANPFQLFMPGPNLIDVHLIGVALLAHRSHVEHSNPRYDYNLRVQSTVEKDLADAIEERLIDAGVFQFDEHTAGLIRPTAAAASRFDVLWEWMVRSQPERQDSLHWGSRRSDLAGEPSSRGRSGEPEAEYNDRAEGWAIDELTNAWNNYLNILGPPPEASSSGPHAPRPTHPGRNNND